MKPGQVMLAAARWGKPFAGTVPRGIRRRLHRMADGGVSGQPATGAGAVRLGSAPVIPRNAHRSPDRVLGVAAAARQVHSRHREATARCLLVTDTLDAGGVEEVVAILALGLPDAGLDIAVATWNPGGRVAARLSASGADVVCMQHDHDRARAWVSAWRPDVIAMHQASDWIVQIGCELRVPMVETLHNSPVWMTPARWRRLHRRHRQMAGLVAVSDRVRRHYLAAGSPVPPERFSIVPNSFSRQRFQTRDRDADRAAWGLADDDVLFVSLARYEPQKNLIGLLHAFDRAVPASPGARLAVAGNVGDPLYHTQVTRFRERLSHSGRVTLLGHLDDPAELLGAADVFVLDSFFEGGPMASMEALALGVPVILSDAGGAADQVGGGARGILVPAPTGEDVVTVRGVRRYTYRPEQANTAELTRAIMRMTADRDWWAARRAELRGQAADVFDERRQLRATAAAYTAALERSPGKGGNR
ncbi:MAG: glycosyltransferase [Propionibacteriales bacterium]|nr:glycosyltransferase [Propionibacteriales bacterium]